VTPWAGVRLAIDLFQILPPEAATKGAAAASEVYCEALLLPVAIAHSFGALAAAKLRGQVQGLGGFATLFSLGQGALGFGGERLVSRHGRSLARGWA